MQSRRFARNLAMRLFSLTVPAGKRSVILHRLIVAGSALTPDRLRGTPSSFGTESPWPSRWARGTGREIVVLESEGSDTVPLHEASFPLSAALVLGNEALGVSGPVVACADLLVHVPQSGLRNCLNVSSTAAVLGWELQRKRLAALR